MPQNRSRDEENSRRKQRIKNIKRGPGVFVYDGSLFAVESIPTIKLVGSREPVLDEAGFPVTDGSGRQVFKRSGDPVKDENGKPVLGGTPKIKRTQLDVYTIRGTAFPKGEAVEVGASLAFKLRCMDGFEEQGVEEEGDEPEAATPNGEAKPRRKKKRSYRKRAAAEAGETSADEGEAPAI